MKAFAMTVLALLALATLFTLWSNDRQLKENEQASAIRKSSEEAYAYRSAPCKVILTRAKHKIDKSRGSMWTGFDDQRQSALEDTVDYLACMEAAK